MLNLSQTLTLLPLFLKLPSLPELSLILIGIVFILNETLQILFGQQLSIKNLVLKKLLITTLLLLKLNLPLLLAVTLTISNSLIIPLP